MWNNRNNPATMRAYQRGKRAMEHLSVTKLMRAEIDRLRRVNAKLRATLREAPDEADLRRKVARLREEVTRLRATIAEQREALTVQGEEMKRIVRERNALQQLRKARAPR